MLVKVILLLKYLIFELKMEKTEIKTNKIPKTFNIPIKADFSLKFEYILKYEIVSK
jgi:hypothetical protein